MPREPTPQPRFCILGPMLKKILIAVLVLIAAILLIGAFLPARFEASRTIEIQADRTRVHEFVGELKRWDSWGPWKEEDPSIVVSFGEKTTGIGAYQSWTGDSGNGELTFSQCSVEQGIVYDMNFFDGDKKLPAKCWMKYNPVNANSTQVTWGMEGSIDMPLVGGWIVILMQPSLDDMIQKGLNKLKAVSEAQGPPLPR